MRTARTIEAAATGTRARVGWRLAAGSALLASGVLGLALAPAGVAGAQQNGWGGSGGSGGSGSQWGGSGGNGGQGCEGGITVFGGWSGSGSHDGNGGSSSCCSTQGTEALLAYPSSDQQAPRPGAGQSGIFYYEDETPLCKATATATVKGGGTVKLPVTTASVYPAVFWPFSPSRREVQFLRSLTAVDASLGASPPNAADPLPDFPAWNGAVAPYVTKIDVSVPTNLAPGRYTGTLTVKDSDGEYETYTWRFSVEMSTVPVGAVGGVGVAAALGGGLLLVQGTRRRRRVAARA
ncbi:hypothetical protein ACFFRE_04690 [Aciditerrimonas ferrireducens]|uniref:Secreted protein n=1 Tax=Aciditerrimonas ferrireducens TaxID=667306 RepID=A0ABV6C3M6_9ACTN